jgi:DNA-binding winged helix-turn-helix (wHTH) protein
MPSNTPYLRFGSFQLNPTERLLLRGDREIHLASKLFETLLFLVQNGGHLVEKETLMRAVWKGTFVEEGSLAHSISVLRKILGRDVVTFYPVSEYSSIPQKFTVHSLTKN